MKIALKTCLPAPYDKPVMWAKADMLSVVSFDRLALPASRKDEKQRRIYEMYTLPDNDMERLMECVLCGLGLR